MKTDYSKPSADVAREASDWQTRNQSNLERQRLIVRNLKNVPDRSNCLLCEEKLTEARPYRHRSVDYVFCDHCGQLQTKARLPAGYPHDFTGDGFETIYPPLDDQAYVSRRDRIYLPKLEWALSRMTEAGRDSRQALNQSWMEIGCGAGYFLDALLSKGARNVRGIDGNAELVSRANKRCGDGRAAVTRDLYADIKTSDADILVAFFVLEHMDDARRFWDIMGGKPSGSIFLFAVPTFGFSTILEGAVDGFAARHLDSVIHTQLYTDRSINYALTRAGYDKAAEWLFGQDVQDLCRFLTSAILPDMDRDLGEEVQATITNLIDPIQSALDRMRFCDARHVLAVKR